MPEWSLGHCSAAVIKNGINHSAKFLIIQLYFLRNALHYACEHGHYEIVKVLIGYPIDINCTFSVIFMFFRIKFGF